MELQHLPGCQKKRKNKSHNTSLADIHVWNPPVDTLHTHSQDSLADALHRIADFFGPLLVERTTQQVLSKQRCLFFGHKIFILILDVHLFHSELGEALFKYAADYEGEN